MDYHWFSTRYRVALRLIGAEGSIIGDKWDALAFGLCLYPHRDPTPPWRSRFRRR